jgi:hypothetical protein
MNNFGLYAQAAQQAGGISESIQRAMQSDGELLVEMGVPPEMVQSAIDTVGIYAQTPIGGDAFSLSPR